MAAKAVLGFALAANHLVLAWILAWLDRDRQRGARRAWLAAAQSVTIVRVFYVCKGLLCGFRISGKAPSTMPEAALRVSRTSCEIGRAHV